MQVSGGYDLSLSDQLDGKARASGNKKSITNSNNDGFYAFSLGLSFSMGNDDEVAAREARQQREIANAEARRIQDSTNSAAEAARVKAANVAEAQRVKDATDAAALRLAQQKSADTVFVLVKGKTIILKGVNFEPNKATLTKGSETILWRTYNAMVANPNVRVVITGHTDNVGSQKDNQILSLKRAQAVKNWLIKKGIASSRMRTVGRGENEPMSSNETAEGRADNRRIEFYVQ